MFLLALSHASTALACTPTVSFAGFDAWLDGGVGVPTDARLVILAEGGAFAAVLTRDDTDEVVPLTEDGSLSAVEGPGRMVFTPDTLLEPNTSYTLEVLDGYYTTPPEPAGSTTFTTGDGPTPTAFAAPEATLAGSGWEDSELFYCTLGNPVVVRTVTGTAELPADLPPGSYLGFHSAARAVDFEDVEALAGQTSLPLEFLQGEIDAGDPARDCLTPVIVLPNGDEVAGAEVCLPSGGIVPPDCGCASTAGAPLAGWALLALVAGRRRR